MGKMKSKILTKTLNIYLGFSIAVLVITSPLFYYIIEKLYVDDVDESLTLDRIAFSQAVAPTMKISDIAVWNRFNRDEKIENNIQGLKTDSIYFQFSFDTLENENEPHRYISSPITIEGQKYTYTARIDMVESEDMIMSIAFLFFIIVVLLLIGLYFITRFHSQKLWNPFYKTLEQIERFELNKNNQPVLDESEIEEFNRLNNSVRELIERNLIIYKSQQEFIENATHELQTPLAVLQAKLDTFMQRSDLTADHSEILSTLNDSVARLIRINKNLMLLSKIDNKQFPENESIFLKDSLEKQVEFFKEQAKSNSVSINLEIDHNLCVQANSILVDILIGNLFMNAVRHNIKNGTIEVKLISSSIIFTNTGEKINIPPEKIFDRFSKSSPSKPGSGLGLSIVKKIADLYGWSVKYSNTDKMHIVAVHF